MDTGWLTSIGSIGFGLIALIIPFVFLLKKKGKFMKVSFLSLSSCLISLLLQIYYFNYLAKIEDFSAIQDTSGTVVFISISLTLVVILLNVFSYKYYKD